jgi:Holliday junction resolvase
MAQRTFESEKDVKAEIRKLLTKYGWYWWMPPGNGFGKSGVSDFNAIHNGVFLAIEAKFGLNKPTKAQVDYLMEISSRQGMAFVVNENLLTDLDIWLTLFDRATVSVQNDKPVSPEDQRDLLNVTRTLTQLIKHEK